MNTLRILGVRGVPANHGGFETFAEHLALYLVKRNWRVVVYCQNDNQEPMYTDEWCGVERIHISAPPGSKGSIVFDWRSIMHAAKTRDLCLTLGYNTAAFCSVLRVKGIPNLINMDGIEWSRAKWGGVAKAWFWANDWAGCWLGNHLVADHPHIKKHLSSRVKADKITMIPYGADAVLYNDDALVREMGLTPGKYVVVIARPEPENSLLEIVAGFSQPSANQTRRDMQMVVLGKYDDAVPYHRAVKAAANESVRFVGAIYDKAIVQSLRFHSALYIHGHQVGGTNPSLVESLGCGNAVIAHDNRFNRWVAGEGAAYFSGANDFSETLDAVLADARKLDLMRKASIERFMAEFTWPAVLEQYENLLLEYVPATAPAVTAPVPAPTVVSVPVESSVMIGSPGNL
jgi:glycosyltransferase involved in cell wall biosynthesis